MVDGLFIINNALSVNVLSMYNDEERFQHTLETVDSIDKYCPSNAKFMFDASPNQPKDDYFRELFERGVVTFYCGQHPDIKALSNAGLKSVSEGIAFMLFMSWFRENKPEAKRIYKLSGRYRLNENLILNDDRYKDAFVFANALDSWLPKDKQESAGVDKLYRLRLWHMDDSLFDTFTKALPAIFEDCKEHGIDVEHSYYKNLHTQKVVEVDTIGVSGNIAHSGEYINE